MVAFRNAGRRTDWQELVLVSTLRLAMQFEIIGQITYLGNMIIFISVLAL